MSTDRTLLASAFDPLGLYLASAVLDLDAHKVRVQPVDPTAADSNSTIFVLEKEQRLQCLSWVSLGLSTSLKKQKKGKTSIESRAIAIGLTNGNTVLYSPTLNSVVATLTSPSGMGVANFHFSTYTGTGFTADFSGTIHEWDLSSFSLIRSFTIANDSGVRIVSTTNLNGKVHILAASESVYLTALETPVDVITTFPGHVSEIHTVLPISDSLFLTSAKDDRFINCYSLKSGSTSPEIILVASDPIWSVAHEKNDHGMDLCVAITDTGKMEIFNDPTKPPAKDISKLSKRNRHIMRSKKSNVVLTLSRPLDKNPSLESLPIQAVTISARQVIISWLEEAVIPFFDKLAWWKEDAEGLKSFGFTENVELVKERPNLKHTDHRLYGHDVAASKAYNEAHAVVISGDQYQDLSDDETDTQTLSEKLEALNKSTQQSNGLSGKSKKAMNAGTLTVVLTQALSSNDHTLLESVINNKDDWIIRNTIAKLSPSLVVTLLNRLSERIARNYNRQGALNVWIKWIMIIHGGYLNNYPSLTADLSTLHSTLNRRANTLDRLLELKGKVSLVLDSIQLKREILHGSTDRYDFEESDEDEVEYVEELDDAHLLEDDDISMSEGDEQLSSAPESDSESEDDEEQDNSVDSDEEEAVQLVGDQISIGSDKDEE
ncbi:unnamed protein product [Kuraishia capsulata CBS 1993]|uniref:Small-subunit processome Utp12 domain-containing protein n=1 Tax=Kuraishia capsulata CBS 1993 TaxID=1382522 RepID=W6MS23_9ASCO|nr:uncharacterized protein KUCA_T00005186001 [Kuraishia capsulata CBS 1993]CDK29198.1 unnamed protein product [Kuraishia capsulata CBS 1993]